MISGRITAASILGGLALVLAVAGTTILSKQAILDDGRTVLLALRPADPRSLMQGDYMVLRYDASVFPPPELAETLPRKGRIILALDDRGVARFARLEDGAQPGPMEARLVYRLAGPDGELRYGAESYFFQEGRAEIFQDAKYGVLKLDPDGNSVLAGLADAQGRLLVQPD